MQLQTVPNQNQLLIVTCFKIEGDNPITFLLVVYASDIKQDGCYAGNVTTATAI